MNNDVFNEAYASLRHNRRRTTLTMMGMAWGIATVVLLLAYGSRRLVGRPDRLARIARVGKPAVGALLVVVGVLSLTGTDKALETRLLDLMPTWLVDLTTRL